MLRISKLTDYATVIMSYLALDSTRILSATQVARQIHLSIPTVSKILKILAEARLVTSFRGTGGGYQLARPMETISVADIVIAVEGNVAMTECSLSKHACALDALCGVKENWQIINNVILKALKSLTLADMNSPLVAKNISLQQISVKVEAVHG